eukprot:CAMPEP_0202965188 /NCGR_PEP_ID=MMETSP1396-20130829/9252_1 /ASSEMBLY_ACC=CAM_ASM_000872 /TAXON_ID= /ORGANISM="Pseudokeronopsis sp., Strain Brazil" /LENGTH=46 /DNA_ID= /DNA_START= /DNA_END= /DNA_ORIENTATION=
MKQYQDSVEFREFLIEFSSLMGSQFESIADKKKREDEEAIKNDPIA